jgi:anti-anti-sigma factor
VGERTNFAVTVERADDDCIVVSVDGDLDLASADEFEAALSPTASATHAVIDLSSCTFLDSAGMRVITATVRRVPRVSVVATDPGVLRALEITAVDTMVAVHTSLADAL